MRTSVVLVVLVIALLAAPAGAGASTLRGTVESGTQPLAQAPVAVYSAGASRSQAAHRLGSGRSDRRGRFAVRIARTRPGSLVYVVAGRGLAAAAASSRPLVVNERTTAALGFALAQFVGARGIAGPAPGPANAFAMARNLVDVRARIGNVLASPPNGGETSALRTFNSLANMLVPCARQAGRCRALFRLAKPRGGQAPKTLLAAAADIARNPAHSARALFGLARSRPAPYTPALTANPGSWTLALRFFGDGTSLNGPGNMAIDAQGNVWTTNNYEWSRDPAAPVCGSTQLMEFTPAGRYVPHSPFTGGGLNGAGFGITLDPRGHVWVGNFGFASQDCPVASQPPHDSVSEFAADGTPLSPPQTSTSDGGWGDGGVSWPQGTVSDRQGNIWIANCANDSVTRYAKGDHSAATNIPLAIREPFDIAFNGKGVAFVTGNVSSQVAMVAADGTPLGTINGGGLDAPLGIGADSKGNMWVANSQFAGVPCPTPGEQPPAGGSLTLISSAGKLLSGTPFTGGGLNNPWGVAADGNDNVWVANFGGQRLSEFCGTAHKGCRTGSALSPAGGFAFDGLVRNTGVQVDPSGNVWLANNWKDYPFPQKNPGGYEVVAFLGLAAPIRTPLIGPPRPL